jgi:hypothetical protein
MYINMMYTMVKEVKHSHTRKVLNMNTATYNGWHNYETWNVSLWINNDEGFYNLISEMTNDARDEDELASSLESLIMDEAPQLTGIYADLLTTSLRAVDWNELAADFWSTMRDDNFSA